MRGITARQQQALDAIAWHLARYQRPPTLRWLGESLGISSLNGVNDHLRALEKRGFIMRDPVVANGIRIIIGERCCPLCGRGPLQ